MSNETRLVVNQLINDLRIRPRDFFCGECTITDKKTGIEYWISNGRMNGAIYWPYEMRFGLLQSLRFHSVLDKWKAWNMITASNE